MRLLRNSYEMLAPKADYLAKRFYEILFEQSPEIVPLFAHANMGTQRRMFIESLTCVLGLLENAQALNAHLFGLGQKHADFEITENHFPCFGQALLAALAEVAGPVWNDNLEAVWTEAFEVIADGMIAGMRSDKSVQSA